MTSAITGAVVSVVVLSVAVVFSVVVVCSSFSPQEKIKKLISRERIMSICLVGFLIGYFRKTLHIP